MNKQELVDAIAKKSGLTKTDSSKALEAFIAVVETALKKGDEVRITNFGTFSVTKRNATKGRNPRTGATIKIAAYKQPKFRAGKGLKVVVNK
ncbi:MAG: HU family DNA-binding protein [Lactobacillales bacterium]|jgi:DNA-binding protein HU-beta|nr:HU family DNA-binding protein [Lactobacillales bacterium]